MPQSDQTRLLIIEDVPQVAQYIRGLLNAQQRVKLLEVLTDGSRAIPTIKEMRPDIVLVDALLQGRIKGLQLVEMIHAAELGVPVIVLTVPQTPIEPDANAGIHGVLSMPFSGFDLMTRIASARKDFEALEASTSTRVMSVFAPKGGVGKTTIAFNLAVALGQLEQRTVLIDGSLQFGDLRSLLKVPVDAPSILDLPTDRIAESDLGDVLWRDPSGIDILLAPPRIEMAEMLTPRDVDKVLSLLRRVYGAIVIDMSSYLNDINLAFLDSSDVIIEIVTYDSTTIHNTVAIADTFRSIGYPASKVRYLVNRADSPGGIDPGDLERALGPRPRAPRGVRRHARGPVEQRGRPVRAREPRRGDQQGPHARRRRTDQRRSRRGWHSRRTGLSAEMADPRPIGVFDSGVGGLTVLREIVRRSPAESTVYLGDNARAPYGVRSDEEVLAFSTQSLDLLAEREVKAIVVACNTSTAVAIGALRRRYDLPILGVIRPGASAAALATRNRRVGVIATPATIRSHAYFSAIKDENPAVEVYEHATPTLVPLVEAGELSGPIAEAAVADALAPLIGERDAAGESIFPRPPVRPSTPCCSAVPTIRCSARSSRRRSASTWRSSTRPPRRRRRWRSCSGSTVSRRTRRARGPTSS